MSSTCCSRSSKTAASVSRTGWSSRHCISFPELRRDVDGHVLSLRVVVEHDLERAFPAQAALLLAAEEVARLDPSGLVDLDPARLDLVRRAERARQVARPDVCGEAVVRVVRETDDLALVLPRDRDEHGPEHFFSRDAPGRSD